MIARVDDRLLKTAQAFFGAYLISKMEEADRLYFEQQARQISLMVSNSRGKMLDDIVDVSILSCPLDGDTLTLIPEFRNGLAQLGFSEYVGIAFVQRIMYRTFLYAHPAVRYSYAMYESMSMCEALVLGCLASSERANFYDSLMERYPNKPKTSVGDNRLWAACVSTARDLFSRETFESEWGRDFLSWICRIDVSCSNAYEVYVRCAARIAYKMVWGDICR